jgi:hypothetical protein
MFVHSRLSRSLSKASLPDTGQIYSDYIILLRIAQPTGTNNIVLAVICDDVRLHLFSRHALELRVVSVTITSFLHPMASNFFTVRDVHTTSLTKYNVFLVALRSNTIVIYFLSHRVNKFPFCLRYYLYLTHRPTSR